MEKKCKQCGKSYPATKEYFLSPHADIATCKACISLNSKNSRALRDKGLKKCIACGEIKMLAAFEPKHQNCKACKAKQALEAIAKREALDELKRYDWEDEYRRVLHNTTQDRGLRNYSFNYPLNPGEKYRIKTVGGYREKERVGKVIQMTEDFFVIESDKKVREAFRFDDYLLGEYEIERIGAR